MATHVGVSQHGKSQLDKRMSELLDAVPDGCYRIVRAAESYDSEDAGCHDIPKVDSRRCL